MLPSTPPWTSSAPRTTCSAATASPPASRNGGGLRPLRAVTVQDPDRLRWLLPPALSELLDVVVTRQDAPPKPAPDGLHLALSRLNTKPERAVFVGDSPTDMTAARAAGVLALGAVWGWHPPTALRAAGASHLLPAPTSIGPRTIFCAPSSSWRYSKDSGSPGWMSGGSSWTTPHLAGPLTCVSATPA
ncbi:HAD-IA family hydrolase [Streptomyces sp. NPDC088270]|uniref:HAD family hydrolase n=1 Tax=Streptomyces sp. NPDC088270 TaxID=3160990 RepID=UPI00342E597C